MIAALRGVIEERGPNWLLLSINGVSFHVWVPAPTTSLAGAPGDEVRLYTHLHVREDALSLYGFLTPEERDVFVLLMSVSGVGPRGALSALSVLEPAELARAVEEEDSRALQRSPGLGPRTADRVIVELKGKLAAFALQAPGSGGGGRNDDLLGALLALGYTQNEARRAIVSLREAADLPIEERLRRALQELGPA